MKLLSNFLLRSASWWPGMAAALLIFMTFPSAARCEYLLHAGDIIAISTIGSDDLKQTSMIRGDGKVVLPLVGELNAAGLSIGELRSHVISLLSKKVLRKRTGDGREFPVVILADQLSLTVAEYSPVYVTGDVAKPGSQIFRPGMTARQAIALAGGYDIMRFRMQNPFLESADLRAEYESLWSEFVQKYADALRIRTELANGTELDPKSMLSMPFTSRLSTRVLQLENELLAARNEDKKREISNINSAMKQESKRIETLATLERKENQGAQADETEYNRVKALFDKGAVPITRVSEMRRLILISSTRELQTTVQRYGVEREQHELTSKLQRFGDERKIGLLKDLQTAETEIAKIRSRLQATEEKLAYTSMVKSQLTRGKGSKPDLVLHSAEAKSSGRSVNEDTELQPGDVLEVALRVAPLSPSLQRTSTSGDEDRSKPN